jgi:hypothetical protein
MQPALANSKMQAERIYGSVTAPYVMFCSFSSLQDVGAHPGLACAAYFGYMKGVKNALAMKHVPWVLPRNDTLAGGCGCGRLVGQDVRELWKLHAAN